MSDQNSVNVANVFAQAEAQPQLNKLVGNDEAKAAGSHVFSGQDRAVEQGFRNVSSIWYGKTISYEQGLDAIEQGRSQTEDILATVKEMVPSVENGSFAMRHVSGRCFRPTEHAVTQMGNWADTGTWFVQSLLSNPKDAKGRQLYSRDSGDAETLAFALRNGFRRLDQNKKFLFRTQKDGTLRAMLTERYAIVDNRWFIERLREFVPGGRLSHWRGDSNTLWGNVLIPDTIREEKDSDYGGMLSIGNSEIGERRVSSMPSLFRAICMNGCIWGQIKGTGIRQVHRGRIDLDWLANEIKTNLNKQIPLVAVGLEHLLGIRSFGWDGASAKTVIAQVAKDYKLSKGQASAVLLGYHEERQLTPDYEKTLFGVVNGITRAGQKLSNSEWLRCDEIGGEIAAFERVDFDRLINKAKHLAEKEVEDTFAGV